MLKFTMGLLPCHSVASPQHHHLRARFRVEGSGHKTHTNICIYISIYYTHVHIYLFTENHTHVCTHADTNKRLWTRNNSHMFLPVLGMCGTCMSTL